jgi:tripartite-type tricarboxylate transporter receptor subunit TctC
MSGFMRHGVRTASIIATLLTSLTLASAQNSENGNGFPNRTVKILVGFGAGGGTDAVARIVAKS